MKQKVMIVVPAYNEEESISDVLKKLHKEVPKYDIVVINDGSRDGTSLVLSALGEKELKHLVNLGYGKALQTGMKYAIHNCYDIMVTFDADGQHKAEDVLRLVNVLLEGDKDLVIGSRFCNGQPYTGPFGRRLGQYLFSILTRLLIGERIYDTTSGFKAIRLEVCKEIAGEVFLDFHLETLVRLSFLGYKITEIPIKVAERNYGKSMYSLFSAIEYPLKTIMLTFVAVIDSLFSRRSK